jgi:dCTP deaminase
MMILSAQSIRDRCVNRFPRIPPSPGFMPMIWPFAERGVSHGRSYGLSSASYDVRLDRGLWLFPGCGRLASTVERFVMPHDVAGMVKDKSSNARRFVLVQNTFIDPGWSGYLTLELTRFLPWPVYLPAGLPIAQIVFVKIDEPTERPYGAPGSSSKYQHQERGPQPARFEVAP